MLDTEPRRQFRLLDALVQIVLPQHRGLPSVCPHTASRSVGEANKTARCLQRQATSEKFGSPRMGDLRSPPTPKAETGAGRRRPARLPVPGYPHRGGQDERPRPPGVAHRSAPPNPQSTQATASGFYAAISGCLKRAEGSSKASINRGMSRNQPVPERQESGSSLSSVVSHKYGHESAGPFGSAHPERSEAKSKGGCVALPRVVHALGRPPVAPTSHRALPTTKMPSHLRNRICETPH